MGHKAKAQERLLDGPTEDEHAKGKKAGIGSIHHTRMLQYYGTTPGETCGDCTRLWRLHYENAPYKCSAMSYTLGHDTDWGVTWPACGKWEARDWRDGKKKRRKGKRAKLGASLEEVSATGGED